MRALEFGPLDELEQKYGNLKRLEDMPRDSITRPAVVFKPADPKKQVVPWDSEEAIELWQKRQPHADEPLPDIFAEKSDVIKAPGDIVGRNKLVLKARSVEELMYYTTDDE
jgi:anaerobic dimethyl sulfoxide reductase subunit B (iron-sulfur subunit)